MSRKNLALIELIPRVVSAGIDAAKIFHKRVEALGVSFAGGKLRQPLAESGVEGGSLRLCDGARLLDEVLVRAEGEVFHTKLVYTSFVQRGQRRFEMGFESFSRKFLHHTGASALGQRWRGPRNRRTGGGTTGEGNQRITSIHADTGQNWSDKQIFLEGAIITWLGTLQ